MILSPLDNKPAYKKTRKEKKERGQAKKKVLWKSQAHITSPYRISDLESGSSIVVQ
ncbi:hypothetical protein BofuT4_uP017010.1 [Botrytis cinerea T4]|uniref:Uncharacterized protein n=1 Tax=Botryotinia fuckeliana (strain T4) TaxID=999810 RepID=G2YI58_BOTF4|nr:hypothetical protein BofuT4_uP017010.1 [Botrytis cinerea T4]